MLSWFRGHAQPASADSLPWSIARRLLSALVLFFVIVSLSFLILAVPPFAAPSPTPRMPAGGGVDVCGQRATWALDQPAAIRYLVFVANIFRGQWGSSRTQSCAPVLGLVLQHAPDTLILTFGALALSGLVARAIGPALARRHGRFADAAGSAAALGSAALPAGGLGVALLLGLMATGPGFVPVGDHSPDFASKPILFQLADYLAHLLVPFLAMVALSLGFLVLAMRSASLFEQGRRGPRLVLDSLTGGPAAPGEKRSAVPALVPELLVYAGWTMSASLLVEIVFGLDGLGSLLAQSVGWDPLEANGVFLFLALLLVAAWTAAGRIGSGPATPWLRPEPPIPEERLRLARFVHVVLMRPASLVGLALLTILVGMTLSAPSLAGPYNPYSVDLLPFQPPSPDHPLGTGAYGIEVLSAVLAGGAVPLLAAASSFVLALAAGTVVAITEGVLGGRADRMVDTLIAGLLCLPWLPLAAIAGLALGPEWYLLVAALSWPIPAAIIRRDLREFLQSRGFPEPKATGGDGQATPSRFWTRGTARYLVSVGPLIVSSALLAASLSVLVLSGIAFLFVFVFPGELFASGAVATWPGWQSSLAINWIDGIRTGGWFSMLPFVFLLFATSLAFAVLGFSLREASLPFPLRRMWPKEDVAVPRKPPAPENG